MPGKKERKKKQKDERCVQFSTETWLAGYNTNCIPCILSFYPFHKVCFKPWLNRLTSQCKPSTCAQLAFRLTIHLRRLGGLVLTLVELKFARKSTQVSHCLATQHKSTQVDCWLLYICVWTILAFCDLQADLPLGRLATHCKSVPKFFSGLKAARREAAVFTGYKFFRFSCWVLYKLKAGPTLYIWV